jgi:hypothetical protein
MDIYRNKETILTEYYQAIALAESQNLLRTARSISRLVLRDGLVRARFENEIKDFISAQMQIIKSAKTQTDCKAAVDNLNQECRNLIEQDQMLRAKKVKTVVEIEIKKDGDMWGYVIQGVYIVFSGLTAIGGFTLTASSVMSGNIVGVIGGATIFLHGINGVEESLKNLINHNDNTMGFLQKRYIATAEFLGFDKKAGMMAYNLVGIGLSGYGMARLVLKPDTWRLFRYIPSDYVRNIKTMGYGSLAIEGTSNIISIKAINDIDN